MNFQDLINTGYCSESGIGGTALGYCPFDIKRLKAIWRHPLNFKYPDNFAFTLANLQALVQTDKLIPIYKTKNAKWVTPENGVQTFEGGDKAQTDKFPYEAEVNFTNGFQFHQVLEQIEKAGYHSFTLVDEDDNIIVTKDADGTLRGINSEFFNVSPYMPQGQDTATTKVGFQLNRKQVSRLAFLKSESYDFAPESVTGVVDIELTMVAPVAAGNTFTFTAKQTKDNHSAAQLGLVTADFRVKAQGTVVPGTVALIGNTYTFTRTTGTWTAGNTVTLETYDTVVGSSTVNVNDVMIRAAIATSIVVP